MNVKVLRYMVQQMNYGIRKIRNVIYQLSLINKKTKEIFHLVDTHNEFKNYVEFIKPLILSTNGLSKKAIIFDCDNTLWKGVLGEDGFDNITIYQEIQYLVSFLNSLTDPSARAGTPETRILIPARDSGPDGNQLDAVDQNGDPL